MRVVLLGTVDDVRGFALAGVPGVVVTERRELEAGLRAAADAGAGLVLVSAATAALAPAAVAALAGRDGGPAVLVLPEGDHDAHAGERGSGRSGGP